MNATGRKLDKGGVRGVGPDEACLLDDDMYAEIIVDSLAIHVKPDMQKLITVADFGITDYSSWAYDYLLTRRPLFLYAPDLKKYNDSRGFYYPLETTPFPISESNEQLQQAILSLDIEKYQAACDAFLAEKGCVEDGHAAERVVDKIEELLEL